jgi:hypothetical protein
MAFRKYQKVERTDVVSPEGHDAIANSLHRIGKTSAASLNEDERKQVTDALEESEHQEP